MSREIMNILEQVAREKGLPLKVIVEAMVTAIEMAARKRDRARIEVKYDDATGTIRLFEIKAIVETVTDAKLEFSLLQARKMKPDAVVGEEIVIERDVTELGRISAQKAKQIINQKVKEAEKQKIYDMYQDRVGDVVLATVQRIENGVIVNLGEVEAVLPKWEQLPGEFYKRGDKFRAMIMEVKMGSAGKGPQIVLSRTCDEFLLRLFEIEVPEIAEGIVEIAGVAREPGIRAKIGVRSLDRNVDSVGACVGMRGSRIQSIVRELRGEKIDIIEWSDDPATLIARALTPARVQSASTNRIEKSVDVIVADDQLALAIGKRGQNAKLAVKLTRWRINISSESERRAVIQDSFEPAIGQEAVNQDDADDTGRDETIIEELEPNAVTEEYSPESDNEVLDDGTEAAETMDAHEDPLSDKPSEDQDFPASELLTLEGVSESMAEELQHFGFCLIEDIAETTMEALSAVPGIGDRRAKQLIKAARAQLTDPNFDPHDAEVGEDEE
jgi:transcription termination/antitermination protein NusA